MKQHIHIHLGDLPQLAELITVVREGFQTMSESTERLTNAITDTMNDLNMALDRELSEIATALSNSGGDPTLVNEQTERLLAFRDTFKMRVEQIIP